MLGRLNVSSTRGIKGVPEAEGETEGETDITSKARQFQKGIVESLGPGIRRRMSAQSFLYLPNYRYRRKSDDELTGFNATQ